jgi:restriction endonuclease S subunit
MSVSFSLLYYILKNDEEKLNKLALITNTINLSRTNLENYEICIPSEEFQQKIIDTVSIYDKMCENLLSNNTLIEKLFNIDVEIIFN